MGVVNFEGETLEPIVPIEPGDFTRIEPDTALGRALVEFFDVLEPVYAGGKKGVF